MILQSQNGQVASRNAPAPAQVTRVVPFSRAALKARQAAPTQQVTLSAAAQSMSHVVPAIGGWNRWIALEVVCTTAGNSAAVTFAVDGPYNVFTNVLLKDASQKQLLSMRGIDLYLMNLFGGYRPFANLAGDTRSFSAVTGTGATGGSFSFVVILPQECAREAIGAYPNMDSSQRLTIDLSINLNANIYGTPPTTPGTLVVRPVVYYYRKPAATNVKGEPQQDTPSGAGTMQYWRSQTISLDSGENIRTINLSGRYIRNAFGIFTTASDVRSDTVRPSIQRWELDNELLVDSSTLEWDSEVYKRFGLVTPTGFSPIWIGTSDPDGFPGAEWADDWLPTATSSQLVGKFTTGAAGKLFLLLNEIEPNGEVFRY